MQIGGEGIKTLLMSPNVSKKKNFKRHKFIKTHFHVSLLGNGLKKFQFETLHLKT
jgi:hypothetical protein